MSLKYFFCVITCAFTFYSTEIGVNAKKFTITEIRENTIFVTDKNDLISMENISIPNHYTPGTDHCYHRKIKHFLEMNVKGTKFQNLEELEKMIISHGMAKTNNNQYIKDEARAQNNRAGIWEKPCNDMSNLYLSKNKYQNKKKLKRLNDPVSVQTVTGVTGNNDLVLENGNIIKVMGLRFPSRDQTQAERCFYQETHKFLQYALIGRQVLFKKDRFHLDREKILPRHVFLFDKGAALRQTISLAEHIIKSGYARSDNQELIEIERQVYQNPLGAWTACTNHIYTPQEPIQEKNNCPIKGNITGTNSNPVKKYHTVHSPWYERTKAELCFESETEAVEAGFEKVK